MLRPPCYAIQVLNRGELIVTCLKLDFYCSLRLSNVCLFLDSLQAILGVLQHEDDLGSDGTLILLIWDLINELGVVSVMHIRR